MTPDLTVAVERLRDDISRGHPCTGWRDDVHLVLSALESAQQDARRYRWLRDGDGPQSSRWSRWRIEHWASPGPTWADIRGADLDAAIDAHLKGKP